MDDADAEAVGIGHAADAGRLAVDVDRAGLGDVDSAEHLDERGLAGAVLAQQGMNLAAAKLEITASRAVTPPKRLVTPCSISNGTSPRVACAMVLVFLQE